MLVADVTLQNLSVGLCHVHVPQVVGANYTSAIWNHCCKNIHYHNVIWRSPLLKQYGSVRGFLNVEKCCGLK